MPVSKSKDVGTLRKAFKKEHPEWSDQKNLAASLEQARKNGAKIKPAPKNKRKVKRSK